jgi:uncharacterized protein (DUF2147 family)
MNIKSENKIGAALLIGVLVCTALAGVSQTPEKLEGTWMNDKSTRKGEFYKQESKYNGKIVWVSEGEEKLSVGDVIFKDLTWDGKKFKGLAVTPRQGNVPCTITFENDNKIKITVSKGRMSRSVYWSRVE